MDKKKFAAEHRKLVMAACRIYNRLCGLKIRNKGTENRVEAPCALMKKTRIIFHGDNNRVTVGDFSQLSGVTIDIHGSNHQISLGSWSTFLGTEMYLEQGNCSITVKDHAHFYGKAELAAMEGTSVAIGEDCLCSSNVQIRTGDSHSVLDMSGRRTNVSRDITLGEHVWLGRDVTVLKGSIIGDHCLVGTRALVTGQFPERNCAIGGVPARILKKEVDWSVHHIPAGEIAPDFQFPEA